MVFSDDEKSKLNHHQFKQPVFQPVPPRHPHYLDDYASSRFYYPNQNPNPIINNNSGYYGPLDSKESHKGFGFGRAMIVIFVFVILSLCFITLVFWMLFGVELPEFRVSSLVVPAFNATSSTLVAKWNVRIAIFNPNADSEVYFDHVMTSIHYDDNILAEAPYEDVHLDPQQKIKIRPALATQGSGTPLNQETATQIEEERKNTGYVTFGISINTNIRIKSPSSWKSQSMRVSCVGMVVVFSDDGIGYLTNPKATKDCLLEPS